VKAADVTLRIVGGALVAAGAVALFALGRSASELMAVWDRAVATGQGGIARANAGFLVAFASLVSFGIAGGVQFLRRRSSGYWLSLVGMVPQIVALMVPGFQYRYALFGFLAVGLAGVDDHLRAGFQFEGGTQLHVGFEALPFWAVQINVGAAAALALIIGMKRRARAEATRVEVPQPASPTLPA
jgi:hypothetical protein